MTWRTYESFKKYLLCYLLGLIIGFSGGYLCFRENVPGDGNGVNSAREELNRAQDSERQTEAGIGEAKDRADRITDQIGDSQRGIGEAERSSLRIEEENQRAGDLIGESQSILSGIRERGEEGKEEN